MDYTKGVKGTFPTTVVDALYLPNHYKPLISNFRKKEDQIAFLTNEDETMKYYTNAMC